MTKQECERRMERARQFLIKEKNGLCYVIFKFLGSHAENTFKENFRPRWYTSVFWLGDTCLYKEFGFSRSNLRDNMTQLERRLVFLESFKGFCTDCEQIKELKQRINELLERIESLEYGVNICPHCQCSELLCGHPNNCTSEQ